MGILEKGAEEVESQPLLRRSSSVACSTCTSHAVAAAEPMPPLPQDMMHGAQGSQDEAGEGADSRVCRICFDTEDPHQPDNPLISPCLCSGGSSFVHRKCLQQWRETSKESGRTKAFYRCEVCHFEYKFIRLDGARWLSHPVVVPTVFALILMALAWISGYVPLTESIFFSDAKLEGAAKVACHITDGLIIMGLVGLVVRLYMFCADITPTHTSSPCCAGCNGSECVGCAYVDCSALECAGAGELCGPVLVVVLVIAAVAGLVLILPVALGWMYELVDRWTASTVHMVENIDRHQAIKQHVHSDNQPQSPTCGSHSEHV